ncbi:MAG: hypothetical protein WC538_22580 [Thermoanaerobaculia bacterium]
MNTSDKRSAASIAAVIGLLALFAILSRSAALTKSATWDETLHAAAGWSYVHAHDWRANPEHPPLTKLWSAVVSEPLDLAYSTKTMAWRAITANLRFQWNWAVAAIYRSPAIEGDAFIQRARLPMLAIGIALGALIAFWAWRIGGAGAALVATTLFAFSPDFIGHSSLVTNDVALAFAWLAVAFTAWRLGERITLARIALLALAVACALLVKFSGLLALPLVAVLLALRASENRPWRAGRTELARVSTRGLAAVVILLEIVVVCWALIWCAYGLRISATAEDTPLDFNAVTTRLVEEKLRAADPGRPAPTAEEVAAFPLGTTARFALFCQSHSLLPESWNWGLLAVEASTAQRPSYLLGNVLPRGSWYYFPLALLFKEPVAAVVGVLAALTLGVRWLRRGAVDGARHGWLLTCLFATPAMYAIVAIASRVNIGVRHIFPVLPFVFIAIGVVAARAMRDYGRPAKNLVVALAALLAIETLAAWPNYIAFFNAPSGGTRGGLRLLGDSNLDWGQDLKLLATWQKANPDEKLYLFYNGSADPTAYGIKYVNAFGGYAFGPPREPMTTPGVLAISATNLQGIYATPEIEPMLRELRKTEPMEVLGGTIYLYRFGDGRR